LEKIVSTNNIEKEVAELKKKTMEVVDFQEVEVWYFLIVHQKVKNTDLNLNQTLNKFIAMDRLKNKLKVQVRDQSKFRLLTFHQIQIEISRMFQSIYKMFNQRSKIKLSITRESLENNSKIKEIVGSKSKRKHKFSIKILQRIIVLPQQIKVQPIQLEQLSEEDLPQQKKIMLLKEIDTNISISISINMLKRSNKSL
jgi:hypothetical protein